MLKNIARTGIASLAIIASLALGGCAGEAGLTAPAETTSLSASSEPTATPTPVVETFGSPDASLMEALEEAGAYWPEDFPVADEDQFWRLIGDGIELRSVADADSDVTVLYGGGELGFDFEAGRFYLED